MIAAANGFGFMGTYDVIIPASDERREAVETLSRNRSQLL